MPRHSFRTFFFRGLGILLPTILTIWILVTVFNFMYDKIALPINSGVREAILATGLPPVEQAEIDAVRDDVTRERALFELRAAAVNKPAWDEAYAKRVKLNRIWGQVTVAGYPVLDLIGLLIAAVLVYMVGVVLGSFFGKRILTRLELFIRRVPLFKQIYPHVKQVTDFLFPSEGKDKVKFNRVVAVEYPRKGVWSVGLVTGNTMLAIEQRAKAPCVTVFVPSSPTPFTGYVITVPVTDTIELPVSIDEALRFTVSLGVLVPDSQTIAAAEAGSDGDGPIEDERGPRVIQGAGQEIR